MPERDKNILPVTNKIFLTEAHIAALAARKEKRKSDNIKTNIKKDSS